MSGLPEVARGWRRLALGGLGSCGLALAPAARLGAQGSFEGQAVYRVTTPQGQQGTLTWTVKGNRLRQDAAMQGMPAGGMYTVIDATTGAVTTVMPSQKMYMRTDTKRMAQEMAREPEPDSARTPPRITKTGKVDRIAGHACEHYILGERQDTDACVAKGLGTFMGGAASVGRMGAMMGGTTSADYERYAAYFKEGFFPLQVARIENGNPVVIMEATKVVRKPVDPSVFRVPARFREMKMPAMQPPPSKP